MNDKSIFDPQFQLSSGGLLRLFRQRVLGPESGNLPMYVQLLVAFWLLWLPLVVLTLVSGTFVGDVVAKPFINDLVPQVRLLVALPLLVFADMAIDPAVNAAIRNLQASRVVPDDDQHRFRSALARLARRRDSIWPDVVMLLLAYGITWIFQPGYGAAAMEKADTSWLRTVSGDDVTLSIAGWWYVLVSGPLFQFALFRWLWRFLLWAGFLRSISQISLTLRATHPDLCGGIGILGLVQQTFTVVFVAFAAVMSSTIGHNILYEGDTFEAARPEVIVFVVVCIVVIYAPLLFFTSQMYAERRRSLSQYGALGHRLSESFNAKWMNSDAADVGTELKNSADPSAMADYAATFDTVRRMRAIPVSFRSVGTVAALMVAPFIPLYLTEFSVMDLLKRMADALV